jgi:hypothetical protein
MRPTDITASLHGVPDEFATGWNWAEAAVHAWIAEAKTEGISATEGEIYRKNTQGEAGTVQVDGARYLLSVDEGTVRAVRTP